MVSVTLSYVVIARLKIMSATKICAQLKNYTLIWKPIPDEIQASFRKQI